MKKQKRNKKQLQLRDCIQYLNWMNYLMCISLCHFAVSYTDYMMNMRCGAANVAIAIAGCYFITFIRMME